MVEITITKNIPPQLEQYIKEFFNRKNYIVFGVENKLFELIKHCDGEYSLKCNKQYIAHDFVELEDIYNAITDEINKE